MLLTASALAAVLLWPRPTASFPALARRWSPDDDDLSPDRAVRVRALVRGAVRWVRLRRSPTIPASLVAECAEALGPALSAGLDHSASLRQVGRAVDLGDLAPILTRVADEASRGSPVGRSWLAEATRLQHPDLLLLARAWTLSEESGAPLVTALGTVAAQVRRREAETGRLAVATAGVRTSMVLLLLLPLAGPLIGLAFGLGPLQMYAASPAAVACLLAAALLVAAGWLWSRRLLAAAVAPERVR